MGSGRQAQISARIPQAGPPSASAASPTAAFPTSCGSPRAPATSKTGCWLTVRAAALPLLERRHHVLREPAELLLELGRAQAFRPVNHEVLEARIFRLDRLDALDDVLGRSAEPGLLRDAVGKLGRARRRARRAPGAALLVGVAHETERREPLVAFVMGRLDLAHRLGF